MSATLCLAGCASDSQSRIGTAATTPLNDLNVVRTDIPVVLEQARQEPYVVPVDQSCDALTLQVRKLDEVLGADLDTPPSESNPGLIERGSDTAGNAAIGALQRTAEGIVPFRGWVRKISGAEQYSRRVAAAIAAGTVRRAFLKGLGVAHGCVWSAPAPAPAKTACNTTLIVRRWIP
jgi:hypothetical protein